MDKEQLEQVEIRGLTLWQPWASAMSIRENGKIIETRSWSTEYRGWLAIHASAQFNEKNMQIASRHPFKGPLLRGGYPNVGSLPLGCFVCLVELKHVESTNHIDPATIPELQQCYGDFSKDRYAWYCENMIPLKNPIPGEGLQRLFRIDPVTSARIIEAAVSPVPNLKRGRLVLSCPKCGAVIEAICAEVGDFIKNWGCSACRDKEADALFSGAGISYA